MTSTASSSPRFAAPDLLKFAQALLEGVAMPADKAQATAEVLVEGDLLGHDTHGLHLLSTYLPDIQAGHIAVEGEPTLVADLGAVLTWDGHRLPGCWLTLRAIEAASERARRFGVGIVSVRHSHHIAALAPYARRVAEQGLVLLLMSSAPAGGSVAPFGGTKALFSPSPIAVGIPTRDAPMMIDVSTSITTNGLTGRLAKAGRKLPHAWLMDEQGAATDDPAVLVKPRAGTILPLGGMDAGHKGYGLSLMVEALTAGLAGSGRGDPVGKMGATLFVQVIDPAAFSGGDVFEGQMQWVADACRSNPPRDASSPVRLPGERGLMLREQQLRDGVAVLPDVLASLEQWAGKLGVAVPEQVG